MIASAFLVLALIALLGSLLRSLLGLDVDRARQMIGVLVLQVFLPALNFHVIVQSDLGKQFWQVPVCAAGTLAVCLLAGFLVYRWWGVPRSAQGAFLLAGAFGNVTYFGLPLLQGLYPRYVRQVTEVVILYEMTITPLNLLAGSALASAYGQGERIPFRQSVGRLARMPLLWAVAIALVWNASQVPVPEFLLQATELLGKVVPGLMILSLGMALKVETLRGLRETWRAILPATVIKLVLSPLLVFGAAWATGLAEPYFAAIILLGGMPTQLATLITAEYYKLDVPALAVAIFVSTVTSFVTLPIVHALLG